jgi:quinol monooxygenase YgiN
MSDEIVLVARFRAAAGRAEELVELCREAVAGAAAEPGTLEYRLHRDGADPDVVVFYERYADQEAFAAHRDSERMTTFGRTVAPLLDGAPDLMFLSPVASA